MQILFDIEYPRTMCLSTYTICYIHQTILKWNLYFIQYFFGIDDVYFIRTLLYKLLII